VHLRLNWRSILLNYLLTRFVVQAFHRIIGLDSISSSTTDHSGHILSSLIILMASLIENVIFVIKREVFVLLGHRWR
jgi:hypothetical protein